MSCDSRLRPAGVIPPLFRNEVAAVTEWPPFFFAHRARAAADSLARVAADTSLRPARFVKPEGAVPMSEAKRSSRVSICLRIEIASSNFFKGII
jgi:hypothetical protein